MEYILITIKYIPISINKFKKYHTSKYTHLPVQNIWNCNFTVDVFKELTELADIYLLFELPQYTVQYYTIQSNAVCP